MRSSALLVRLIVVSAASQLAVACGELDTVNPHNLCVTDSDCDPGHVCVGRTCWTPPLDSDASYDAGVDKHEAGQADLGGSDFGGSDLGMSDPCMPTGDDGPRAKATDVPGSLTGVWKLCNAATADSSVLWLVGGGETIQIDDVTWRRGAGVAGQTDASASPAGLYFQVVEGPTSMVHFIDPDVASGAGGDFSAVILTGAGVLELSACDGAASCTGLASRFAPVGSGPPPRG